MSFPSAPKQPERISAVLPRLSCHVRWRELQHQQKADCTSASKMASRSNAASRGAYELEAGGRTAKSAMAGIPGQAFSPSPSSLAIGSLENLPPLPSPLRVGDVDGGAP